MTTEPPSINPSAARESWADLRERDPSEHDRLIEQARDWLAKRDAADHRESDFWDARPELSIIRQFAMSRLASPWAVLGGVLARVVATTPSTVHLPATVGGRGSLNLYVAFVGPSGGGKGIANAVAREVVVIPHPADESQVGTGEGLVHAYMRVSKDPDTKELVPNQYRTNVLLDVPEVDSIRAQSQRQGATLLPYLRSAWSGEAVGRSTADVTRNLSVPAHCYRLAMTVGVQPGRADALLNDTDGGTPQRFVWVPVIDASLVDGVDEPEPIVWEPPAWRPPAMSAEGLVSSLVAPREMEVCEVARKEIRADRLARARGEGVALDGHAMLARLKVAAALAILNARTGVEDEDWALAAIVMEVSDRTRSQVQGHLEQGAQQAAKKRGVFEAEVAKTKESISEGRDRKAVTERLLSLLTDAGSAAEDSDQWMGESALRKAFSRARRDLVADVLAGLKATGKVESRAGHTKGSTAWRIAKGGRA